jgi:hypothetical protein
MTKAQARLLAKCPDKMFEFMKTQAQEHDAFELFRAGMLDRRFDVYSMRAGGKSMNMRWAYRRTAAGREALKSHSPDHG